MTSWSWLKLKGDFPEYRLLRFWTTLHEFAVRASAKPEGGMGERGMRDRLIRVTYLRSEKNYAGQAIPFPSETAPQVNCAICPLVGDKWIRLTAR